MAGSRVALVADDPELARSVLAHLERNLHQPAHACSFTRIGDYLDHRADGLLLLAAATDAEAVALVRLVQDISLQKLPPMVVLLDCKPLAGTPLDRLEAYVSRRLRWPEQAALLTDVVRELGRDGEFPTARAGIPGSAAQPASAGADAIAVAAG